MTDSPEVDEVAGTRDRRVTMAGGWVPFVAVAVAAAIPRLLTAGHFQTVDEPKWMLRSGAFADALMHGHPSGMAITSSGTATMPGITTMWLGTFAKGVFELSQRVGLIPDDRLFEVSTEGVAIAQSVVAVTTGLLIGLVAWLVARWASRRVGLAFGLLVATGPFWVAHGAVLHTDELMTLFGIAGLVSLAIAFGVPRPVRGVTDEPGDAAPLRWLVAAGVLLACAVLTKLSALAWGVSALVVVIWAVVNRVRTRPQAESWWKACRSLVTGLAVVVGCIVVTVALAYPALWLAPTEQWQRLRSAAELGGEARETFFRGQVVDEVPFWFYAYALPWRMTPWALAIAIIGVPIALIRRASRSRTVLVCAVGISPLVVLSLAAAKYDRYALMLLAPLLLAGCLALQPAVRSAGEATRRFTRFEAPAWIGLGLVGVLFACIVAPWGLVYFNTALGGGARAESTLPIGWFEERSAAYAVITRDVHRRGGTCASVATTGTSPDMVSWSACGRWEPLDRQAEYLVIGISKRQRMDRLEYWALTRDRKLVEVVKVRGIRYAEVWRRDAAES